MNNIIPVVLSGGVGSRLWPVSREGHPKPFIKLPDGQTLLEKSYKRVKALGLEIGKIITVTNESYYFTSLDELSKAEAHGIFLLEPCGRNTTAAIAMAALYVKENFGETYNILVLSADHLIESNQEFRASTLEASKLADQGELVTFGVLPTRVETGYGYIEIESEDGKSSKALSFVEKPDYEVAKTLCSTGRHLWNAGIFCFNVRSFLDELEYQCADIYNKIYRCWQASKDANQKNDDCFRLNEQLFLKIPDISIDHSLLEKTKKLSVVLCKFDWNDVGSWGSIAGLYPHDAMGNNLYGDAILLDVRNTLVHSEGRLVAAIDVDGLIIVETADAVLVASKGSSQKIKNVVSQLKANSNDAYRLHRTVHRPWGTYTILEDGLHFKIKKIVVKPHASLSLQLHRKRSEHWIVIEGMAHVTNGDVVTKISKNESTFIPAGCLHRLENPANSPCVIIEVQCGEYLGEDDIERYADIYGRHGHSPSE